MPPMKANKPTTLGLQPSFGFGDRLGTATAGHLDALRAEGGPIKGIFAQQSIREMTRTNRTPSEVMTAATQSLETEGFNNVWGADADHLKTENDVDITADAGFVFFTIDPSDDVDQAADSYNQSTLTEKFNTIKGDVDWLDDYSGKTVPIDGGPTLIFDEETMQRAAVKYAKAIDRALSLAQYIKQASTKRKQDHEIELSVDETEQPTTPAEHYIIADRFRRAGVKLVSLAPRYIGDFEKGVDYKGDLDSLRRSLNEHAAIAKQLGPYKLSLHSGSDKLSMYGILAEATEGTFHIKTAGTSYLEALRVVARHDEALFRKIVDFARQHYDTDKATYHVSATVAATPAPSEVADIQKLESIYLERWPDVSDGCGFTEPGRQILHCTFGSVLTDPDLGQALANLLDGEPQTYRSVLAEHFAKHLSALCGGM